MALKQKTKDASVLSASGVGPSRSEVAFVVLALLLLAILLAVFWTKQERAALKEWSVLLSATADEQEAAIGSFLEQKAADAAVFASFPSVVGAVDPELRGTVDAGHLESVLEKGRLISELSEQKAALEIRNNFITRVFGRYLSDAVVEQLLETPDGLRLGGERRVVTVVMTDLRGFTATAERIPPESVVALLNLHLGAMSEIVLKLCLLYTSPSPRDRTRSRMPSSA